MEYRKKECVYLYTAHYRSWFSALPTFSVASRKSNSHVALPAASVASTDSKAKREAEAEEEKCNMVISKVVNYFLMSQLTFS